MPAIVDDEYEIGPFAAYIERDAAFAALRASNDKMRTALAKFRNDMCEGWCGETDHIFSDCQGCEARAALKL